MATAIDTLEIADRFERVGFDHEKARALASAFAETRERARENLVTQDAFDQRLDAFEARLVQRMTELELRLTKHIGEVSKDVTGRLWSTVTIIAGVSTAISAIVGASVALFLR